VVAITAASLAPQLPLVYVPRVAADGGVIVTPARNGESYLNTARATRTPVWCDDCNAFRCDRQFIDIRTACNRLERMSQTDFLRSSHSIFN
jgi:hypothetical protein